MRRAVFVFFCRISGDSDKKIAAIVTGWESQKQQNSTLPAAFVVAAAAAAWCCCCYAKHLGQVMAPWTNRNPPLDSTPLHSFFELGTAPLPAAGVTVMAAAVAINKPDLSIRLPHPLWMSLVYSLPWFILFPKMAFFECINKQINQSFGQDVLFHFISFCIRLLRFPFDGSIPGDTCYGLTKWAFFNPFITIPGTAKSFLLTTITNYTENCICFQEVYYVARRSINKFESPYVCIASKQQNISMIFGISYNIILTNH